MSARAGARGDRGPTRTVRAGRTGRQSLPARSTGGFSLVELLMGLVLFVLVMGSVYGLLNRTQVDHVRQRDANRAMEALRTAEMAIVTVLRSAEADPHQTGNGLLHPDPLGRGTFDNLRVTADINPADGAFNGVLEDVTFWRGGDTLYVRWQAGGSAEVLAHPVTTLTFDYYGLDGTPLTTVAAVQARAKRVKLTLGIDRGPKTSVDDWRETWVELRNRRY